MRKMPLMGQTDEEFTSTHLRMDGWMLFQNPDKGNTRQPLVSGTERSSYPSGDLMLFNLKIKYHI